MENCVEIHVQHHRAPVWTTESAKTDTYHNLSRFSQAKFEGLLERLCNYPHSLRCQGEPVGFMIRWPLEPTTRVTTHKLSYFLR
jgi:hypothetical protein